MRGRFRQFEKPPHLPRWHFEKLFHVFKIPQINKKIKLIKLHLLLPSLTTFHLHHRHHPLPSLSSCNSSCLQEDETHSLSLSHDLKVNRKRKLNALRFRFHHHVRVLSFPHQLVTPHSHLTHRLGESTLWHHRLPEQEAARRFLTGNPPLLLTPLLLHLTLHSPTES